MTTITLEECRAIVLAFHTSTLPKLSDAWHTQRIDAQEAMHRYAAQEGIDAAELVARLGIEVRK